MICRLVAMKHADVNIVILISYELIVRVTILNI